MIARATDLLRHSHIQDIEGAPRVEVMLVLGLEAEGRKHSHTRDRGSEQEQEQQALPRREAAGVDPEAKEVVHYKCASSPGR